MSKRIEGSYTSMEETVEAVRRLLKDGEYLSSDIRIITNRTNRANLEDVTSVQVDKVSIGEDKSSWEKFKHMFTSSSNEATLEKYGVEMYDAVRFEEELANGHYIVLVEEYPQEQKSVHSEEVTSVSDAIVDARNEGVSDSNPHLNEQKYRLDNQSLEGVDAEDPLLNGSVDRGPIYGVVKDETKGDASDEDNTHKK